MSSESPPALRQRKKLEDDDEDSHPPLSPVNSPSGSSDAIAFAKFLFVLFLAGSGWYTYRFHLKPSIAKLPWFAPEPMVHGVVFNQTIVRKADIKKQSAVVKSFQYAWRAYERDAFGDDDYHPISMTGSNLSESGGIGYFIVDVMDTMKLMGLEGEYGRARTWVETKLDFNRDGRFNTFETTIRVLGGLLSMYQLTNDQLYLDKAVDLADRMLPVFDTPVGLPTTMVNLKARKGISDPDNPGLVSTAEAGTLQLEFKYLSHLTDNEIYWEKAEQIMKVLKKAETPHGLAPIFLRETTGEFVNAPIRLGSRGDSYYEYLLKQHLQTAQTESVYREMWNLAVQGIHDHLVKFSEATGKTYTQEIVPEYQRDGMKFTQSPKQDHLVCFLGGTLMLGATTVGALVTPVSVPPKPSELTPQGLRDWKTGYELIETCMDTHRMKSGLPPEIVHFRVPDDGFGPIKDDWYIKGHRPLDPPPYDARYMLRPETVESLFMAFRLTGDERYRRYGWKIFQSIDRWCKVETGGYSTILDVDNPRGEKEDKMETFFLSETLKYLYLLFSDVEVLPLDKYVFNTEVRYDHGQALMPLTSMLGTPITCIRADDPYKFRVGYGPRYLTDMLTKDGMETCTATDGLVLECFG